MKVKLLYSLALVLFGCALVEAQQLIQDDFEAYGQGDLAMDLTGVNGGQGNWKIYAELDGQLTDFQIRQHNGMGNVLFLNSPDIPSTQQYDNAKYAWKDLPTNGWNNRNTGNNILRVEYEFFTGNFSSSASLHRNVTFGANGTFIAGYQYDPATKRLRGMTRLNIQGEVKLQFILLGPNQTDIFLPPDTWVRVIYQINYNSNEITFQIPAANVDGSIATVSLAGHPPLEIDFVSYMSVGDPMPTTIMYDNYMVSAVKTTNLSVNEALSSTFKLYPNPVDDIITIANTANVILEEINVFDSNGRKVQTQKFAKESEVQLNVSRLDSGVYFLHITTNQGTSVKKIIKN